MPSDLPFPDSAAELERLRAENARLTTERDQLRSLFNQAPALICAQHGPDHVYTFTNPIYNQVLGNRPLVGLPIREALPEVAGQGFFELLDGVYRTGEPYVGNEMPIMIDRRGNGELEEAYFNFVYAAMRQEDGSIGGILTHAVEVTDMVRARQLVQRSEDRFRSLVRATSQLVWITDAEGLVEDIPEWRAYTGQSPEEVRGYGWLDALHPDDRARAEAAWLGAVGGEAPYEVEYRIRAHDGTYQTFVARGTPVLESDGSVREWVGLCVNVEDQRLAAQALRNRETQYAMVMKATQDAIWDWDLTNNHVAWNEGVEALFGYRAGEVEETASWWYDHIHPDDAERVVNGIHAVIDHGGQHWTDEYRYRKADGTYALVVDRGYCIHDDAGRPVRMVGAMHDVTRVREAEAELKASEARFRVLADAMPQQVWTATPDGLLDYVNAQVQAYAARPVEALLGTGWTAMVHPEDLPGAAAAWAASLESGAPYEVFFRLLHAESGVHRWHVGRALPIRDGEGRVTHWYGTNTDVHDQKVIELALQQANESLASQQEELQAQQEELQMQAEELMSQQDALAEINRELRVSEGRFRQMADAMPQMIFTAEPTGEVDYYNQRWYEYTGMTFDETAGWNWKPVHHPDDLQRTIDTWSHCVATGELYTIEYRLRRAEDGEYRWHLGRGVPVRDESGRIVKWYGTNTDIHDQKVAELALQHANETLASQQEELQMQTEELQAQQVALEQINRDLHDSEERIRQLANVMPAIVWAADSQGRPDYYNDHTASYTGMAIEALIGAGWQAILQPDDLPATSAVWARCVASGEPFEHEFRIHHAESGEYRWHIGRAVAIRDGQGRVVRWQGTCTDIDDQKRIGESLQLANEELVRLSAQAQAANKMKSEFLANMSHELRTPLNSIIGYTELVIMLGAAGLGETERSNLDVVLRNARHLLSLINDVLDLSKIEAGKASVHAEPFDARALVEAVVGTAAPMAQEKGLRIAAHLAPGLGPIVSDETKVRQILLNLVSNAVKFTKEGSVDVFLEPRGADRWAVIVQDTGIGIADEHQELVFEEFRQVDASSTRQAGGTGLGLSIARGLARLLGGRLTLKSERGKGSTFTVELPRTLPVDRAAAPTAGPAPKPEAPAAPDSPVGGRIIVAIDDDPEALRLLMEHLRGSGFTVVPAGDGGTGLRLVRELHPAVVTLDVMMPGMDGWQVLGELKADPATADIPIVVLSFVDNKALGFSLGAAAYLTKPIEREQLLGAVERLAPGPLEDRYVLVVEDDPDARAYFRQALAPLGVKVAEAPDGQAAIDLLDVVGPKRPALVLLDLGLPHVDGFGVLARLRADERTREVPVIVVTGRDLGPEDLDRLSGVRRVVPKGELAERLALQDLRTLFEELVPGVTLQEGV